MKRIVVSVAIATFGLVGCNRPLAADGGGSGAHGRYASAGVYPAGRMWSQIAGAPAPKDAATAKLGDDEHIIVVIDSQTGELRQCGNISGYCVSMSPWSRPAPLSAPMALAKHADQLDAEAKAKLAESPAH